MTIATLAEAPARWRAPGITDRSAFLAAHPECRPSDELLAELEPHLHYRARSIEPTADPDRHEELVSEILASIFECATHYRRTDPLTGEPVYDYLQQRAGYIVQHAAGRVYSAVRRQRAADRHLRPQLLSATRWDDPEAGDMEIADASVPDLAELADAHELVEAIAGKLRNQTRRQVFRLLMAGLSRQEVGAELGIARQRVHDHVLAIRDAANEVLEHRRKIIDFEERRLRHQPIFSPMVVRQSSAPTPLSILG